MRVSPRTIRIGTRGSPLALRQTEMVCAALAEHCPQLQSQVIVLKTSGDWDPAAGEKLLPAHTGGKALFAKEIEEALLAGKIDAGVHSMKDMDSHLPAGLVIDFMLPREDTRDAIILGENLANFIQLKSIKNEEELAAFLASLPGGVRLGSASIRRTAFLRRFKPDIQTHVLRGNVGTRLEKLAAGQADITLLAMAGMNRLDIDIKDKIILEAEAFLPCAGQGAVGIELPDGSPFAKDFEKFSCFKTVLCVKSERAALRALGGSCRSPIGAYAILKNNKIYLKVAVCATDGTSHFVSSAEVSAPDVAAAEQVGTAVAEKLKAQISPALLDRILKG